MFFDLVLVVVSIALITVLTARKTELLPHLQRNSVVAGILVTAIQFMILATRLEVSASENLEVTVLFVKVLVCLRALAVGIALRYLFWVMEKFLCKNKGVPIIGEDVEKNEETSALDLHLLSRREIEVARLAAKGYTNAQIAETLYISTETVKRHMASIFEKFGIQSRKDLMLSFPLSE